MDDQLQNLKEHLFGAHLKINRRHFNWVIFLVYIPLTILQYYMFKATMAEVQKNLQQGGSAIEGIEDLFAAPAFGWADVIEIITLLIILPFVLARLRDIGWNMHFAWFLYIPLFIKVLSALLGVEVPLASLFSVIAFVLLAILCTKKSAVVIPPSQRVPFK